MATENVPQRTMDWRYARLGHVTASRFYDVLDKGRGVSKGAISYMYELVGELLTDPPMATPSPPVAATQWGIEHEPFAIGAYSMTIDLPIEVTGFHRHPDETFVGGSPDGLVGDMGLVEAKCPLTFREHVRHCVDGPPPHYVAQMQGLMWVLDREWCDFVSFDPRVRGECQLHVRRVERNDKFIKKLEDDVLDFRDSMLLTFKAITGYYPKPLEASDVRSESSPVGQGESDQSEVHQEADVRREADGD